MHKSPLKKWEHAQTDMYSLVTQVVLKSNISFDSFIDSERILKEQNTNTMNDVIHPNDKGYGILAQEIYMRFANSKNLKNKI